MGEIERVGLFLMFLQIYLLVVSLLLFSAEIFSIWVSFIQSGLSFDKLRHIYFCLVFNNFFGTLQAKVQKSRGHDLRLYNTSLSLSEFSATVFYLLQQIFHFPLPGFS